MLSTIQAMKGIEVFNSRYAADDAAVVKAFSLEVNPISHYLRVSLLNALFNTYLGKSKPAKSKLASNRPQRLVMDISEAIRSKLPEIDDHIESLSSKELMVLELESQQTRSTLQSILNRIIECCSNECISFTSKYLHFYEPNLFVPWDTVAVNVAKERYPKFQFKGKAVDKYLTLLEVYQAIWTGFKPQDRDAFLHHDYETQPDKWRRRNTPVRIIDKALWQIGKNTQEKSS